MTKFGSSIFNLATRNVAWVGLALALGFSLLAPALASADDIAINVNVVDSTPSASPTQFVTLPVGKSATTAPVVDIQLTNLEPYSFVQVFAQSTPVLIASGFADKYGVFKVKANLPNNLEAGDHTITASVQKKGETTAALQTLVKFAVSTGGTVQKAPKGGGAGSDGGATNVTESPVASPQPSSDTLSIGGVLLVGGVLSESPTTWNLDGAPAKVAISLANNYSKSFAVDVSISVTNVFGQQVASIADYRVASLKPKTNLMLIAKSRNSLGQWGVYNTRVTVKPPSKLDSLQLNSVEREGTFFVWPTWPLAFTAVLALALALRRRIVSWLRLLIGQASRQPEQETSEERGLQ